VKLYLVGSLLVVMTTDFALKQREIFVFEPTPPSITVEPVTPSVWGSSAQRGVRRVKQDLQSEAIRVKHEIEDASRAARSEASWTVPRRLQRFLPSTTALNERRRRRKKREEKY